MYKFLGVLLTIFLVGCVGNPTVTNAVKSANETFYKQKSPIRMDVKVFEDGGALMTEVWAGTKGRSIVESATDETLRQDVLHVFQDMCGFQMSDLKEVRIVEHKAPLFYEVWVYHDEESKRDDRTTGISLVLTVVPTGGVDIGLNGNCKNQKAQKTS